MVLAQVREDERREARRRRAGRAPSACEVASIAQLRSPASSISRNVRWRSIASGVVRTPARRSPPTRLSIVPSRPGPAAGRREDRVEEERGRRLAVRAGDAGDLELRASGRRRTRRPRRAIARARVARRRAAARRASSGRSTTSATAPCATASAAKSCPSARAPGTQKKSAPGVDRARVVGEVARRRRAPARRRPPGASAAIRRSRSIAARVYQRRAADARLARAELALCGTSRVARPAPIAGRYARGGVAVRASTASACVERRRRVRRDLEVLEVEAARSARTPAPRRRRPRSRRCGSSTVTRITSRGRDAGTMPTNDAT